jgi:hypothetical protein
MADSELSRLAAEISQLSSALTEATVHVDAIIGTFEGVLRRLNTTGLTVEVPLWESPPPRVTRRVGYTDVLTRREIALVFAKADEEWRLQVRRDVYADAVSAHQPPPSPLWRQPTQERLLEAKTSPLVSESGRTKIQALRMFRPLLDELKRRVQADLEAIRNAKTLIESE